MSVLELFCAVDDFWKTFSDEWKAQRVADGRQRDRVGQLQPSEVMTLMIHFHQSHYRTFKAYYTEYVQMRLRAEFPRLVSYQRFVELMPSVLIPLCAYLRSRYGRCSGVRFIDSTALAVCDPHRIHAHRVFTEQAERGKTSMGWFYGFKVHLVANEFGDLLAMRLTPGNVDDRKPVPDLVRDLTGKLFGDKGYLSKALTDELAQHHLTLFTKVRKNMPPRVLSALDALLLRKRAIMETIFDQLKNISQIEHTRHRSPTNFLVNLVAGLIAYTHQPRKPAISIPCSLLPALIPN